jgi:hypothetical protein
VIQASEALGWTIRPRGRPLGVDRLDRRGTRPGDPTLVASPRRAALHAAQRGRPRSVATSTPRSGEAAGIGVLDTIHTGHTSGSLSPVLSPRLRLPHALQTREPTVGAGLPAQDRPVGMAHCICKAGVAEFDGRRTPSTTSVCVFDRDDAVAGIRARLALARRRCRRPYHSSTVTAVTRRSSALRTSAGRSTCWTRPHEVRSDLEAGLPAA